MLSRLLFPSFSSLDLFAVVLACSVAIGVRSKFRYLNDIILPNSPSIKLTKIKKMKSQFWHILCSNFDLILKI